MRLRIGFLGLGTMGSPIANNLRKAGHDVTVWNRTAAKAQPLVQKGAQGAPTAKACASGRDLVFVCVSDEKALEAVLEGADGVLAGLREGDVLVDLGTSGTRAARSVAERTAKLGVRFLAAPLLGSKVAAEQAQLVLVVGGPAEARERARPALHAISSRVFEVEEALQAALLKLCVNSVGGAMLAGLGEALTLGRTGGLDLAKVLEIVQASTFHSPIFLMKGEQIQGADYEPRFAARLAEKDQRLAQEAATEQGARLPVNESVRALLGEVVKSGRGERDVAAVADLLFDWAKVKR